MRSGSEAAIARARDRFAGMYAVTELDLGAIGQEVIVFANGTVGVLDHDVVAIILQRAIRTTDVVLGFNADDDAVARGEYRGAHGHIPIDGIFEIAGVTEGAVITLIDAEKFSRLVRQGINVIVVVVRVERTPGPFISMTISVRDRTIEWF